MCILLTFTNFSPIFLIFKVCFLLATYSKELLYIQPDNFCLLIGICRLLTLNAIRFVTIRFKFIICYLFSVCHIYSLSPLSSFSVFFVDKLCTFILYYLLWIINYNCVCVTGCFKVYSINQSQYTFK